MKILIDARFYGLENGGLGRYTMNLLKELIKIPSKHTYLVLLKEPYYTDLQFPDNFKKLKAISSHYSFFEQLELPLLSLRYWPQLTHFLHLNVPLFYFGTFCVTIHDLIMHYARRDATTRPHIVNRIKRAAYHMVFRSAVTRASTIITPTKTVKRELLTYYPFVENSKVEVLYEGVDTSLTEHGPAQLSVSTQPFFLFVGNAYPHKNLEIAIDSIIHLNKVLGKVAKLVIVTPRNMFFSRLKKVIAQKEAQQYVVLLPIVTDAKLKELYSQSEAFVFPSLMEGFGLPGLEAMSFGTPVIASDIPVFHEVYADNAFYFDPQDHISLAVQMKYVTELKSLRRAQISKRQKLFVKQYSWSHLAELTLKIYNSFA